MLRGLQQIIEGLGYQVIQPIKASDNQQCFIMSDMSCLIVEQKEDEYRVYFEKALSDYPDYELLNRLNLNTATGRHMIERGSLQEKIDPFYIYVRSLNTKKRDVILDVISDVLRIGSMGYSIMNTKHPAEIPQM